MSETISIGPDELRATNVKQILEQIEKRLKDAEKHPDPAVYNCALCRDTGMEPVTDDEGVRRLRPCRCTLKRRAEARMRNSGLGDALKKMTFDTFRADTPSRAGTKKTALKYVDALLRPGEGHKPWLFVGGNPGSGKTHICTAVCGEMLKNNKAVLYMKWISEAQKLKALMNDPEMEDELEKYITCDVLYIDDLMKSRFGRFDPSDADIRLAFMILNERYLRDLPTIISCEWDLCRQMMPTDEGLFSRVYERSRDFIVRIERDKMNNYRIKGK